MSQLNWGHAIAMQCGVVPLSFGPPGVGKTAFHRSLAKKTGREFIQLILRQRTPEDIGGIPVVQRNGDIAYVEYVKSLDLLTAERLPTLLLLDEFNHAPADVLGAAQELVNNPPSQCWMGACANPLSQATDGHELPPAVVNRMVILEWHTDHETVRDAWIHGLAHFNEPDVPIVPADYMQYASDWGVAANNCFDTLQLGHVPEQGDEPVPFASLRSVTNFIRLMAACDSLNVDPWVRRELGAGSIGMRAADLIFSAWEAMQDDRSVFDVDAWTVPKLFQEQRAAIQAAISHVRNDRTLWVNARKMVAKLHDVAPELAVSAAKTLVPMRPADAPRFDDLVSRHMMELA